MKKLLSAIGSFFSRFYMFVIFLFLYAPIVLLMVFSFNDSKSTSQFTGFSLRWYQELFSDSQIMDALGNTLLVLFSGGRSHRDAGCHRNSPVPRLETFCYDQCFQPAHAQS